MGDWGFDENLFWVNVFVVTLETVTAFFSVNGFVNIIPPAAKRHVVKRMVVFIFQKVFIGYTDIETEENRILFFM
jgi:hypothetical protein